MALINVTLPDGTVNEYASGITCAEVITDALGRKHGCLAAVVDGVERDMSCALDHDCSVEGIRSESDAGIHILRHSAAHLLAQAVMAIYPDAKPTIGPAIDRGFLLRFCNGGHYRVRSETDSEKNAGIGSKELHGRTRRTLG